MNPFIVLVFLMFLFSCNAPMDTPVLRQDTGIKVPKAKIVPHMLAQFSDKRTDNYYWLRERKNKEVLGYLEEENAYTERIMAPVQTLQTRLYDKIIARIKEDDVSYPVFDNGYYYYTETVQGGNYYKLYRKKGALEAPPELLLDIDSLAQGYDYFNISGIEISPDNKWLVYGADTLSRRQYGVFLKNLETQEVINCHIAHTSAQYEWTEDSRSFLYVRNHPETLLSEKVYQHFLGIVGTPDALVYEERDKTNYLNLYTSASKKYLFIYSGGILSSETYWAPNRSGLVQFTRFAPRQKEVLYEVDHQENRFIIKTNRGAKNFRVMQCPLEKTRFKDWQPLIEGSEDLIEGISVFKNFLALSVRNAKGLTQLKVYTEKDNYLIPDLDAAGVIEMAENPEYDVTRFRFQYYSMVRPASLYEFDIHTKSQILLKQKEVPRYMVSDYETQRIEIPARDGVKVPVTIVYKKGIQLHSGNNPFLLYGYGSYGITMDPYFSVSRTVLLDKGFIFAIAHIRGGEDLGRSWYEDGKLLKKKNTFNDFIDAAQYFIDNKYTAPEHLYAMGGSAGGLLMGAVANMAPHLFKGIIAAVPFVDVLTTMSDATIPLSTNEYDEWGNPNRKEYYEYMKSYSPYDNVIAQAYPNMLVLTGLYDSQVQYWEPAKWVAKLRALKTDHNILLLKTDMKAGHGGSSGRYERFKETAMEYAFLIALEAQNPTKR